MITIKENKIKIGSLEWYYREILPIKDNHKTPVILLHGLLSQSFCWLEIMPILGEYGYHGIAPDWLGWGLSGKPEQKDFDYTPSSYLKAFTEFIEGLKLEKISLVVQGFLATIGIQYALQYPEKIDKLIILNTPISSSAKLPWKIAQCGVPFLGDMVTQDPLIVDRTLEKGSGFVISDQNLAFYRKPIVTSSLAGRTLVKVGNKLNLKQVITDIETGLKQWEKPCLIIWGKDDPWLEFAPIEELVNSNKKLKLITIEEAKHYPQEHFSKEISPMIVNFLG